MYRDPIKFYALSLSRYQSTYLISLHNFPFSLAPKAITMAEDQAIAPHQDPTPGTNPTDVTVPLSQEKAVKNLLEICAQNNINVNESLRRAILGKELDKNEWENKTIRRKTYSTRASLLGELVRSHQEEYLLEEETELIKDLRSKMERLKLRDASFEVRIMDGSYMVETPVESSGKAGVQHIATVSNSGFVFRMGQAVRRLLATGSCKQTTEEKTIIEGVNLVLEAGKMYLVLGAPGSGKSTRKYFHLILVGMIISKKILTLFRRTVLKMIADRLPEDSKHIIGGNVEVNGVNRKNDEIYWSVSFMTRDFVS
jgi:ABC-type multidrug transport system fused ATPase/permease subunit